MRTGRRYAGAIAIVLGTFAASGWNLTAQRSPPAWPYGYLTPAAPGEAAPPCTDPRKAVSCARPAAPVADDGILRTLPETDRRFTRNQAYFDYGPADWYPGDHPTMPSIVARGREQDGVRACALCHYPNGKGKMENGHLAGLTEGYILRQLSYFKSGARRSADPRKANTNEMIAIARALTAEEAKAAAAYFASMKWTPWVKVIEASEAPRVRATENGLFLPADGGSMEPLGQRIIEMPEHPERTSVMRDPRAGFVAFVPRGSLAKGEALVTTGAGRTTQCAICHGDDLQGLGNVPGIAGRTASYTARQLYDFKAGTRSGTDAMLMKPVLARLDDEDILAITAYLASRMP